MAYNDKPHAASFGKRYSDDSGWERLVEVDHCSGSVRIEIESSVMHCRPEHLEWLEDAIRIVRYATQPPATKAE